jgi:lysozyme family protein
MAIPGFDPAPSEPGFDFAVSQLLALEGGLESNPADPGGLTKFGISQRAYPALDIAALTAEDAKSVYYRDFWKQYHLDELRAPQVASKMLSILVNLAPREGALILQRALRAAGAPVTEDGVIGSETLDAVNLRAPLPALLAALRSEQAALYRVNVATGRVGKEFETGLLNRAYK